MRRLALIAAALGLSACTPHQAVMLHFGDDPVLHSQAKAIVGCETGHTWDPAAYNRSGASGLFQIMPLHAPNFERVTGRSYWTHRFDAEANARFARWLYDQSGWRPWTCRSVL